MRPLARSWLLLALAALLAPVAGFAASVTVYRCTDAKGQLTLRDTPCRAGEKQESREMLRPKDPPPRRIAPEAASSTQASTPAPRYVVVTPPQPLYECVTPDGERYTSESGQGRPHWEPLWAMGYAAYPPPPSGGGYNARIDYLGGRVSGSVRIGNTYPPQSPVALVPAYPTGQWVYDECHRVPQVEVCDRLRDQRFELNRRWNIAQPSERAQIDRETRDIDARLGNDCGGA
jgi:hypothetical protein